MLSIPPVPRPLLAGLNGLWWIYFVIGIYIADSATPEQVWWLDVWNGGLGGNGFSAFGATVLGLILTTEVIFMVFTWAGNRRRIMNAEQAAEKATKEAEERVAEATKEAGERVAEAAREAAEKARKERDREWVEWLETVKPDLEAGRPPSVPPPFRGNGSAAV